jgi:two-component system, response regulator YesN
MYNLLIVDDEEIAIRGIAQGIDWSSLPIENVYKAYDAEEAKQLFRNYSIHVMISDIDMPAVNGIDLLAWVNERSPQTETIFLTGHADFKYAQQAIHLDSFDYLLKPIDHDQLKECVKKALDHIREQEIENGFRKMYGYYYEQWNKQLPLLIERFWQDVLNLRITASADQLHPMFELYEIALDVNKPILPVLVSVEEWKREFSARDEEIMTYAVKKAAEEILLHGFNGHIIQDHNGIVYAFVYNPPAGSDAVLEERCRGYIRNCNEYLNAVVSCYIGEGVQAANLRLVTQQLADMERSNIGRTGDVFRSIEYKKPKKPAFAAPNLQDWAILIEQGKKQELEQRIDEMFERLQSDQADQDFMIQYYFALVSLIFQLLQKKSLSPTDVYTCTEWKNGETSMKSLSSGKAWTIHFITKAMDSIYSQGKDLSGTIAKVQQFILDNLHLELNRETIAEHVYLNPAYLSRLFRKETGQSMTDFAIDQRMTKARRDLEKTNMKISDIAQAVGYCNFSHFSKQFKKTTGLSPHEYRKKYQEVG